MSESAIQNGVESYEEFFLKNRQLIKQAAVVGVILFLNKRMVRRVVAQELLNLRFEFIPTVSTPAITGVVKSATEL